MSYPDVIASTTYTGAGTSHDIPIPGTDTAGDLVFIFFGKDDDVAPGSLTGWTYKVNAIVRAGDGQGYCRAWVTVSDGAMSSTYNVTTDSEGVAAVILRIDGSTWKGTSYQDLLDNIAIYVNGLTPASDETDSPTPDAVTPYWGSWDTLYIAVCHWDGGDAFTSYPTNYADNRAVAEETGSGGFGTAVATADSSATTSPSGNFTIAGSEEWASYIVAVRGYRAPTDTDVAELDLDTTLVDADNSTNHTIRVSARATSVTYDQNTVLRMALYEGATNRTGTLQTEPLTTSLHDFHVGIPSSLADTITDYQNLSVKFWGYDPDGSTAGVEVEYISLLTPAGASFVGSFTGDAVIVNRIDGSFTGDAELLAAGASRTTSGFTGDAVITAAEVVVRDAQGSNNGAGAATLTATHPTDVDGDALVLTVTARGAATAVPRRGRKATARTRSMGKAGSNWNGLMSAVSPNGAYVYVWDYGGSTYSTMKNAIYMFSGSTGELLSAQIIGEVDHLCDPRFGLWSSDSSKFYLVTGGFTVYVGDYDSRVYVYTSSNHQLDTVIDIGAGVSSDAVLLSDDSALYVLDSVRDLVTVVDTSTDTVDTTITTNICTNPAAAVLLSDDSKIYVCSLDYGGGFSVIATATNTASTISLANYRNSLPGAVLNDDSRVYFPVGDGSGNRGVTVINTSTDAIVTTWSTGASYDSANGIAIHPDDTYFYVGVDDQGIKVVNASTNVTDSTIGTDASVAKWPLMAPNGEYMYCLGNCTNDVMAVIRVSDHSIVQSIPWLPDNGTDYLYPLSVLKWSQQKGMFRADTSLGETDHELHVCTRSQSTPKTLPVYWVLRGTPWTALGAKEVSGTTLSQQAFWKIADSEPTSTTVELSASVAASCVMVSVQNASAVAPAATDYGAQDNASSTTVSAPALSSWIVEKGMSLFFGGSAYNTTPGDPSGYTNEASASGGTGSAGVTTSASSDVLSEVTGVSALSATFNDAAVNIGHSIWIEQAVQPPYDKGDQQPYVGGGYP